MRRKSIAVDFGTGARPLLQRMLRIHAAIRSGTYPNTNTLAKEMEVASRTIGRDIEFMRDRLQMPLTFDLLKNGYYYSGKVGEFPTLQISEGELFAMLVAEKALQQYRGTSFEAPLVSAFRKMSESLPNNISFNLSEWDGAISFKTSAEPNLNLKVFDVLAKATTHQQQLRLMYRKPGNPAPEPRVVDPYHLANVNGEWFLFAYCHLRKGIRTFVPARIVEVSRTGKKFVRDPKFSVEAHLRDSFAVHSGTEEHKVTIRFSDKVADYIREKKWHASQKLRELRGGGVELQLKLSSLKEIGRWVLSWGGEAVALGPAALVAQIADAARALHQHHPKPAARKPKGK